MSEQYFNNPLHALKLEVLLTELVDFYGWEILAAALNFNCFRTNPTMVGSLKFLRKTEWARHKLEAFYLYRFKHLPRPDDKQFALPPRDRIIPEDQTPGEPIVLTLEGLEKAQERKERMAESRGRPNRSQHSSGHDRSRDNRSRGDRPYSKRSEDSSSPWGESKSSDDSSSSRSNSKSNEDSSSPWGKPSQERSSNHSQSRDSRPSSHSNEKKTDEAFDPWGNAKKALEEKNKGE